MPLESSIKTSIFKMLDKVPECKYEKRLGGASTAGAPDVTGCISGIRFEWELKQPGRKPDPAQRQQLREWHKAGAYCAVVCSVDEARVHVANIQHITCIESDDIACLIREYNEENIGEYLEGSLFD